MTKYEIREVNGFLWKIDNFNEIISFFENVKPEDFIDFYVVDNETGECFTPIDIMNIL